MAYSRQNVVDNETIMNKKLYDNLQDGVDEAFERAEKAKEYAETNSGVTATDGTKYRWGKDEIGVYLEPNT